MGKGKELETVIRISGELDKSIQKALDSVAANLDQMEIAARKANGEVGALAGKISDQNRVLDIAKKKYASYYLAGEKNTEQAKQLAEEIQQLSGDLKNNKIRLEAAEKAADQLAGSLDDVGDEAKNTKGGFTVMKGVIANLVSGGIQKLIDKAEEAMSTVYGLSESTREYREDMSKLDTAFETAKHATESGTKVYKELFSVFGEEDRAVEAAQQIAALAKSENEMTRMTRIATGAWAKWGDSLATESLMEAMNGTAKIGKVQGTLADALEWCGVNLDNYNDRLAEMNCEEQRSAYILDTLDGLYSKSAENYRKNNATIIAARIVQSDYNDTLAAMGEKIEPATTAVQHNLNKVLTKALELTDKIDFSKVVEQIDTLTDKALNLAQSGIEKVKDGLEILKKNADWLIPAVSGLAAGFVTYKAAMVASAAAAKAMAIAEGVKTAVLASGATAVTASTVATWALNAALSFLTSPITLVVAAIAALVAGGVALYRNWDTVKAKALELGTKLSEIWDGVKNGVGNMIEKIGQYFPLFGGYLSGWWQSICDAVENVKAVFRGVIDFISNVFAGNWRGAWDNIVGIFKNLFGGIANFAKAPINGVIGAINSVINGINGVGFKIPDWVPVVGGKNFSINIPEIPMFARGGITNGVSIAGEDPRYPHEYIITPNPAFRSENLSLWAEAGRMLGADHSDFALSGKSSGTYYDMGGVSFSPQIVVHGEADKRTIMEAIEAEYPEFIDMLEEWFKNRGDPVYD